MGAHTKTAKAPRKRATGPARAQESKVTEASEPAPTEKPAFQPVKLSAGSTGMTIPEDKAQAVAAMHIAGVPITRICEEVGVSYHTAAALIRNRPELLDMARDVTAKNWKTLAALGTAQLVDRLPQMKDQALSVLSAIATEKAELLAGGATSRVEIIAAPAVDEWSDVVEGVVLEGGHVSIGNQRQRPEVKAEINLATLSAPHAGDYKPPASDCSDTVGSDGVSVFEPIAAQFLPALPPSDRGGAGVASSSKRSLPNSLSDSEIFLKGT